MRECVAVPTTMMLNKIKMSGRGKVTPNPVHLDALSLIRICRQEWRGGMRFRVCELSALRSEGATSVVLGELRIAVFRTHDGALFALEDRCPHRGARLSEGVIYEHIVACRDHGWSVGLKDGIVLDPDQGCVKTFPVEVYDGTVYVEV
jgi:nitrite reductase (NADH) small subunit